MKKKLKKHENKLYHYMNTELIEGKNPEMRGDCSYLRGNCSGLSGDCSNLSGDCSGLSGDFDDCKLSEEERKNGININDLIEGG